MSKPDPSEATSRARALLEKITPWPWAWESIAEKSNEFAVGTAYDADGKPLSGRLPEGEWIEDVVIERRGVIGMNESGHAHFADAEFIADAPELVRALLQRVETLETALRASEQGLQAALLWPHVASERLPIVTDALALARAALTGQGDIP